MGSSFLPCTTKGKCGRITGALLEIDRPRVTEYTWMSEATKGIESLGGRSTFEARGEQTEVTLRHSGFPDDEMGRGHKEGWTWCLSMLAERFGTAAPNRS